MGYEFVDYEQSGPIVIIRLNRYERRNSLGWEMRRDLEAAWIRFRDDDSGQVAILTGVRDIFCAGMDVNERLNPPSGQAAQQLRYIKNMFPAGEMPKPVIGAINGSAMGGGLMGALNCDLRVAAESAVFQLREVRVGLAPIVFLVAVQLPMAITMELALGTPLTAQRAYELGIVNRVVPYADLMPTAMQLANNLLEIPPLALRYTMEAVRQKGKLDEGWALRLQTVVNERLATSDDHVEALKAFTEKRNPLFKGK